MLLWCDVIHSGSMYRVTPRQRPVMLMLEVHVCVRGGLGGGLADVAGVRIALQWSTQCVMLAHTRCGECLVLLLGYS